MRGRGGLDSLGYGMLLAPNGRPLAVDASRVADPVVPPLETVLCAADHEIKTARPARSACEIQCVDPTKHDMGYGILQFCNIASICSYALLGRI